MCFADFCAPQKLSGAQGRSAPNVTHTVMSETPGRQTVEITVNSAIDMANTNALKTVEIIALEQRQEPNMTRDVRIVNFNGENKTCVDAARWNSGNPSGFVVGRIDP